MQIFDFENGMPSCLETDGGTVSVTKQQAKQGSCSLRWDFNSGDRLIFNADIGYYSGKVIGDSRLYTFSIYIWDNYSEGHIHAGFYKGESEKTGMDIMLGFSGWRSVMACFDRDMDGCPEDGMNRLVLTASGKGTVLLDELVTANKFDSRFVMRSYQAPNVKYIRAPLVCSRTLKEEYHDIPVYSGDIRIIKRRICDYIIEEYVVGKKTDTEMLLKKADELSIRDGELGISGKRIENFIQAKNSRGFLSANEDYIEISEYSNLMLSLAIWYTQTGDETASKLYIKLLRHLIMQGFAEGSSFGTHMLIDYGLRSFYVAMFLMSGKIREAGLLNEVLCAAHWFLHVDHMGFVEGVEERKATADDFFNCAQGVLYYILIIDDDKKQASYLTAYKEWLNRNMSYTDGLRGMFKEDGCIYHHHGHYIAYGQTALKGMTPIVYALTGTAYDISDKSWYNLRHIIDNMHFQCNRTKIPIALSGRHPLGNQRLLLGPFKYFALSAMERKDKYGVSLYLDLLDEPVTDKLDKSLLSSGAEKKLCIYETRAYPMACGVVHRRGGQMAVAKGFSRYLWGSEIYLSNNLYGRYRSYGVLEILGENDGFSHDGYDWNRFPGATYEYLPMNKLKANIIQVDSQCGFEEMLLSSQSFAGGISFGENGMFSMILEGHPKYNDSIFARKSIFFHKDFIMLLGSDICDNSGNEVETALFQNSLLHSKSQPELNSAPVNNGCITVKSGDILTDNLGYNYHFFMDTDLVIRCGKQISQDSTGNGETEGEFATAVIAHGRNPSKAGYAYGICFNKSQLPECNILRFDDIAHVVKIGTLTCMSIFKPEDFDMVQCNLPLMIMIDEGKDNIEIAICNPDLTLYRTDAEQYDENGVQKEVGIYSRPWLDNAVGYSGIKLKIEKYDFEICTELKNGSTHYYKISAKQDNK